MSERLLLTPPVGCEFVDKSIPWYAARTRHLSPFSRRLVSADAAFIDRHAALLAEISRASRVFVL